MNKKLKEFSLDEGDKQNLIEYLDKADLYFPHPELIINMLLEYQFDIENKRTYIISENDLHLMVNSIHCMSNEIKQLRNKKK